MSDLKVGPNPGLAIDAGPAKVGEAESKYGVKVEKMPMLVDTPGVWMVDGQNRKCVLIEAELMCEVGQ